MKFPKFTLHSHNSDKVWLYYSTHERDNTVMKKGDVLADVEQAMNIAKVRKTSSAQVEAAVREWRRAGVRQCHISTER